MFEDAEKRVNNRGNISYWIKGQIVGKRCSKCEEDKPINEFEITNKSKGTYRGDCRKCHIKQIGQWQKDKPEKAREKNRKWRKGNKAKKSEIDKRWRKVNPEYMKMYSEAEREENIKRIISMLQQIKPIYKKINVNIYGSIYKVTNIKTNKAYIGQTIQPLKIRYGLNIIKGWIKERKEKQNQKFIEEINKEEDFTIEIIDAGCCQYHLDKLEVFYINKYNSFKNGYNNNIGNCITNDGIEEFENILRKNNLEFVNGELIEKVM